MALTFSDLDISSWGDKRKVIGLFNLDDSYPSGGYPLTASTIGLFNIESFLPNDNQAGFLYEYDADDNKLKILQVTSTDSGLSPQLAFSPVTNTTVRLYYTAGVGTFVAGDNITDTTVAGNTTATISTVNAASGYIDVVVTGGGGNLFNAGDNIQTAAAAKTGTVVSPTNGGAGTPAALYVFSFPGDVWPLGPVVGVVSGLGTQGDPIATVSSTGFPGTTTLRMVTVNADETLEGELLVTPATAVTTISTRVLQQGSASPASEIPAGTDLSAYTDLQFWAVGTG